VRDSTQKCDLEHFFGCRLIDLPFDGVLQRGKLAVCRVAGAPAIIGGHILTGDFAHESDDFALRRGYGVGDRNLGTAHPLHTREFIGVAALG